MQSVFSLRPWKGVAGLLCALFLAGCAATQHHYAGMEAMDRGAYAEAVTELRQAVDLAPRDIQYRQDWLRSREMATLKLLQKAEALQADGKNTEAEKEYRSILSYDRENARALAGLESLLNVARADDELGQAREAMKRGDLTQASRWANRALDRKPDLAEARAIQRDIEAIQAKDLIATPSLSSLYKKPINLEFREANLKMVLEVLSRTTGINFIFDRDVKVDQRTTIFVKQTTLEDAIDVILTTNQLEKKILNPTSVLIYPNTPAKLKEYQDLVVKAFYLSNVEAKQAANLLKSVLKIKEIFVDDRYHMIVLRENPETIALAEKLIALHDLEEPEVVLEVEVLEVNRTRLMNLGVQLTNQFTVSPLGITSGGSSTSGSTPTYKLSDFLHLNSDKLGVSVPTATVNLQKTDSDANLLANPHVRVRDREKAKILIGDKVPVVTTTTTPNGFLSENIQYLEVGLKLDVEPEIHLRDEIGLKIGLEVSSIVASVKTTTGSQAYQIGTRNINSVLRLKDGETQVFAGLISDTDRSDANRVPILGDVPLLGRLFSSQKDDKQKTEIVMSITPRLIRNIQRKNVAAESFWSGTEATLKTKPLQLRTAEPAAGASSKAQPAQANPASNKVAPNASSTETPDASGIKLNWKAPAQGKVGQPITLELQIDSARALRAAPLQFAFTPGLFEVIAVKEGNFFSKDGKSNFNHVVDTASGRISISLASAGGDGAKGQGSLVTLELKPIGAAPAAEISLLGMTPIGSKESIPRPATPVVHQMVIAP